MKLFVSNLSWSVTESELKTWLTDVQGYDVAEVQIIKSGEDGRSRGFGFVTFPLDVIGQEALRDLEGATLAGRPLHVALAIPKPRRNGGSKGRAARKESRQRDDERPISWEDV